MNDQSLIEGITGVLLGVADPDPHLKYYCDQLGFAISTVGVIPANVAAVLWQARADVPATVLTAAGADSGRIILLEVPDGDAERNRYPHTADLGLAAIDLYTRDIGRAHHQLSAAGYSWMTPPSTYEVPLGGTTVTVTEAFSFAPDGTDVVFVEPASPRGTTAWEMDPRRPYTEVTSVVCHVPDLDAERDFWGPDGLGMECWYDVTFMSAGLEAMSGLPPKTSVRLAFLAGVKTARIEVVCIPGVKGVDRRYVQRPGHAHGHTGWAVRTRDLEAALQRVMSRGGSVSSATVETDDTVFGPGVAAAVTTPNGIAVTLYETSA